MNQNITINSFFNILIISEDSRKGQLLSDLIKEITPCHIDLITQVENSAQSLGSFLHDLVVIYSKNAYQLFENVQAKSPQTLIIVIDLEASVSKGVQLIKMGAEDYLESPIHPEEIQLSVKRALDKRTLLHDTDVKPYIHLLNTCQLISSSTNLVNVYIHTLNFLKNELATPYIQLYKINEKQNWEHAKIDRLSDSSSDQALAGLFEKAIQNLNPIEVKNTLTANQLTYLFDSESTSPIVVIKVELDEHNNIYAIAFSVPKNFDIKNFNERIKFLTSQLKVSAKNIERFKGVERLAFVDDATGLHNSRYLQFTLERELKQLDPHKVAIAILFIDVDNFKKINDRLGHWVGTKLLSECGQLIKRCLREKDSVFRYGGDEFVSILSPCDPNTAQLVAERIRSAIEDQEFVIDEKYPVRFTVSIGVSLAPHHSMNASELIEIADQAMYQAKNLKKNSVIMASLGQKEVPDS